MIRRIPLLHDNRDAVPVESNLGLTRRGKSGSLRLGPAQYVSYGARVAHGIVASKAFGQHRPLMVNIEPTHRCNLSCTYCDKVDPKSPQMETQAALQLIDELAELGTISVCFDGGEPLVHPDIEQFVRRAKHHKMRVSMSSNGLLIAKRRSVLEGIDVLKISIDGPSKIHDQGRGSGSFKRAMEGASIAHEAGCSVAIRMTLASHNTPYVREVVSLAKELGIKALFQPAIGNVMDGTVPPAEHSAEVESYRAAIDDLLRLKKEGEPIGNETIALEHLRNWPEPTLVPFCSGGRIEGAIGPDGGMFPCGRTGRNAPAPNVFELGAQEAFRRVQRPTNCANCWCTLTVAACFLYRGDIRLLTRR